MFAILVPHDVFQVQYARVSPEITWLSSSFRHCHIKSFFLSRESICWFLCSCDSEIDRLRVTTFQYLLPHSLDLTHFIFYLFSDVKMATRIHWIEGIFVKAKFFLAGQNQSQYSEGIKIKLELHWKKFISLGGRLSWEK